MIRFKFTIFNVFVFVLILVGNISAQAVASQKAEKQLAGNTIPADPDSIVDYSKIKYTKQNSIQYDSSNIDVRSIDSTKIKAYLKDKDFKYFEDPQYSKTLWERLMEWLNRQFAKLTEYESYNTMWDILIYILIALAIVAILFGIYKSEINGLFFSNKNKNGLNVSEVLEDIHSIDYEKMIEEAIAGKKYRYAIRLNYLRSLKFLSDKEIINWKINKTNREFLKEIKSNTIKSKFEKLTTDFESIWYGGFEIDHLKYKHLQNIYSDFNSSLEVTQK